ncbi:hypothetical protein ATB93_16255 [Sphingomonas sp. WG]|nr:hypothetical protein ATB93_16255 [Sphingomonas sp. WG]
MAWILVLGPPRLLPIAWACAPLFRRLATDGFYMRAVDQDLSRWSAGSGESFEHCLPHALFRPTLMPIVQRIVGTMGARPFLPTAESVAQFER